MTSPTNLPMPRRPRIQQWATRYSAALNIADHLTSSRCERLGPIASRVRCRWRLLLDRQFRQIVDVDRLQTIHTLGTPTRQSPQRPAILFTTMSSLPNSTVGRRRRAECRFLGAVLTALPKISWNPRTDW
jgi:hypothetical protein